MKHLAALLAAALLAGCASAPFLPPPGKRLLAVMETLDEPHLEATWVAPPAAVVGYTSLPDLGGIDQPAETVFGRLDLDTLAQRAPHSALVVGLFVSRHLAAIASGELDPAIDRLAALLARYRRPVFIRFGYEFDGPWFRHDPQIYVAAWRHFRERLQDSGLKFAMVWQSAAGCGRTHLDRPVWDWYPGDGEVDWIGLSYFSPHACGGLTAEGLVAFARAHGKPVMIAEATPRGFDLAAGRYSLDGASFTDVTGEEIWSRWYQPLFDFIERNADAVRVVTYINYDWDAHPGWRTPGLYWGNARLERNPVVHARWQERMRDPAWLPAGPDLFRALGYAARP